MPQFVWGIVFLISYVRFSSISYFITLIIGLLLYSIISDAQVNGVVRNKRGSAIEAVQISIVNSSEGTITDGRGVFTIRAEAGDIIEFKHINYQTFLLTVDDLTDKNIILNDQVNALDEVLINAFHTGDVQMVNSKSIERIPSLLGEKDVLKYMATLPGVISISALDAGIYVRGGNSSHNAYMVNSIAVADPQHITGVLSTFDPYVLDHSIIYKSGYPAQYNGYLSSYINMQPTRHSLYHYSGEATVGLISSSLKAKLKTKQTNPTLFALSMRKSYLQFLAKAHNGNEDYDEVPAYAFTDFTFSLNASFKDKWRLSALAIATFDKLPLEIGSSTRHDLKWGSQSGVVTLIGDLNPRQKIQFNLGVNHYYSDANSTSRVNFSNRSDVSTYSFSTRYIHQLSNTLQLSLGIKNEMTRYDYIQEKEGQAESEYNSNLHRNLAAVYANMDIRLTPQLSLSTGMNGVSYSGSRQYFGIAPRVKLMYQKDKTGIWVDYARTHQFDETLTVFTIKSPVDLRIPIGKDQKPAMSDQYSVGMSIQRYTHFTFNTSCFYKHLSNIKDFEAGDRTDLAVVSNSMISGEGSVLGWELDGIYNSSQLYLRLNYTLSEARHRFDQINDGQSFHPPYDIRHNIMLNASFKLTPSWHVNTMWTYSSGVTTTLPIGVAVSKDITTNLAGMQFVPVYNERYNYQLPATHRMDISLDYIKPIADDQLKFTIGVFNVYNQANPSFVYIEPEKKDDYFIRFVPKSKVLLPFMPYFSLTYIFNKK